MLEKKQTNPIWSPKIVPHLSIFLGLTILAFAIIEQQLLIAIAIVAAPFTLAIIGFGFIKPHFILLLYTLFSFFLTEIMRQGRISQLSIGFEVLTLWGFIAVALYSYLKKGEIKWEHSINMLTISYIPWLIFSVIQLSNSTTNQAGISTGIRVWIIRTTLLYLLLSVMTDRPKVLKIALDIVSVLMFFAVIKLLWQKYIGFNDAEMYWLFVEGNARTHIISSGIRYFSYFSDAANFGGIMAASSLVYGIIGIHFPKSKRKFWYIFIAISSLLSMFISGTRGAMVIPLVGMMLYCLLCKNVQIFLATALAGICFYTFFALTTIGNENDYIRRARSAFSGSKDASMNVRLKNRKEIALFIEHNPFGAGFNGEIVKYWLNADGTYTKGTLPPDSHFVLMWIQTGFGGLILYIGICAIVIIDGCRIVLFKLKNKLLRHTLAAFTCATLGLWASGYAGNNPGMPPTDFLIAAMMAFVLNGPYIDNQLEHKTEPQTI